MKTIEQLIFEKRFKGAEFDPNDYNDWIRENEWEAYTLCLAVAKQLQQADVSGCFCNDCDKELSGDGNSVNELHLCIDCANNR